MEITTLAVLFKGICDSIRKVFGLPDEEKINHRDIPDKIDKISEEVNSQNALINYIYSTLESKKSAYPTITWDESTGTLSISEEGGSNE